MKLTLSLAIAVSFLASLAAAAPAAEPDVALVELEKRGTRPIVVDTSFNCDDNRHCIFLGNGAALRPPFSGARCVDTNERGRGINRCRVSTVSRVSVVCPNGDSVRVHFGEHYSSFMFNSGNVGNIRGIFSGERRRNPNVYSPSFVTREPGADIYISCQDTDTVFSKGDGPDKMKWSKGDH